MNSIPSTGASKDDHLVRVRDLGRADLLNCSRTTIYDLIKRDPDFRRIIGIIYLNSIPFAMLGDVSAYKKFKRRRALVASQPNLGRPRKALPAATS